MGYFTSDMHFFHGRLLGKNDFAPRLFANMNEMNQQLITSWNAIVKETDHIYHLGDLAMHPQYERANAEISELIAQLQGTIHLVKGSRDSRALFRYLEKSDPRFIDGSPKFYFYDVGATVKFDHQQYYLTHYPMLLEPNDTVCNLHGHIHHYSVPIGNDVNAGVDAPERELLKEKLPLGTPLSEQQIKEIYEAREKYDRL